jgi:stage II sporulation protein D
MRGRHSMGKPIAFAALFAALCVAIPAMACLSMHPAPKTSPVQTEASRPGPKVNVLQDGKVEEMDMEAYVLGVVAAEMPADYDTEALKAQAVAARTFTVEKMENGGCDRAPGAQVCTDSSHCQAYCSIEARKKKWGAAYDAKEAKLRSAVEATRGLIILYHDEPILALFHASSGGRTEDVENVFSKSLPYLRSVESAGEDNASRFTAQKTVSTGRFASVIRSHAKAAELKAGDMEKWVGKTVRFPSGRVKTIEIGGAEFTGRQIREMFALDSTHFTLSFSQGKAVFSTLGFGHGVGMSQAGAEAMAKGGASYQQILTHYYTGVTIAPMAP